jgi:hypothetical protein
LIVQPIAARIDLVFLEIRKRVDLTLELRD